jgi:predicted AAA+ superfamily ATPase
MHDMIPRLAKIRLLKLLDQFPAVAILGPRQSGKTTLAHEALSEWKYIDLEKPSDRLRLEPDIDFFLRSQMKPLIFDEAQRMPELFSALRSFIDERRASKGRVVLLGSASFQLVKEISESLAGRIGFLDLAPLNLLETHDQEGLWLRGGFPEAYLSPDADHWGNWFDAYLRSLVERDLSVIGVDFSTLHMQKLLGVLAHLHACLWNASSVGASLGLTYHTVNRYVDILEKAFLLRRLPPFLPNFKKRLTKSPKLYYRDSGFLHSLLRISSRDDLESHPKKGASWEGFVLEQILSLNELHGKPYEPFFWRTAQGEEVDLILQSSKRLIPIEIKSYPNVDFKNLKGIASFAESFSVKGLVMVPEGPAYKLGPKISVCSLMDGLERLF